MLIREMTYADIPQIVEMEKQCFSDPWSEKSFEDSIAREDTIFLVCEETPSEQSIKLSQDVKNLAGDISSFKKENVVEITGYIGLYISFDEANITNVAVSPEYRQKGYGEALVTTDQKLAKEKNVKKMFLEVRVSNHPAISLYEKLGFEKIGIRKNFYEYPREDAYIMSCDLGIPILS
jgi:ribosomal-protein-alanine N-acetyltransferase